jgi:hypothetical protein
MNTMRSVSTAVLLAAIFAVPGSSAFAATMDTAKVMAGTRTDIVPAANLVDMIGSWTAGDLAFLDKAASIKTYDTKALYPADDQAKIASAESAKSTQLGKFHDAIHSDAALNAWFTTNKIDVNRVVAVADPNGNAEIFLF